MFGKQSVESGGMFDPDTDGVKVTLNAKGITMDGIS